MESCGGRPDLHLSATILAGSESKRMGRGKASVQFKGTSLLSLALERSGRYRGQGGLAVAGRTAAVIKPEVYTKADEGK